MKDKFKKQYLIVKDLKMEEILLRSDQNEVAILTLNSPKNLNALSDAMLDALKLNLRKFSSLRK